MTKRIIGLCLLFLPALVFAQKKDKNALKAAASITADALKKHLYIIASKEMEGRDTLRRAWKKQPLISRIPSKVWA